MSTGLQTAPPLSPVYEPTLGCKHECVCVWRVCGTPLFLGKSSFLIRIDLLFCYRGWLALAPRTARRIGDIYLTSFTEEP